jgi:hypothetical protein
MVISTIIRFHYTNEKTTKPLETKGDHLDAGQKKIRLGNDWYTKAGNNYRYLVYEMIR